MSVWPLPFAYVGTGVVVRALAVERLRFNISLPSHAPRSRKQAEAATYTHRGRDRPAYAYAYRCSFPWFSTLASAVLKSVQMSGSPF